MYPRPPPPQLPACQVGALRERFPDLPIHVHTHDTAGELSMGRQLNRLLHVVWAGGSTAAPCTCTPTTPGVSQQPHQHAHAAALGAAAGSSHGPATGAPLRPHCAPQHLPCFQAPAWPRSWRRHRRAQTSLTAPSVGGTGCLQAWLPQCRAGIAALRCRCVHGLCACPATPKALTPSVLNDCPSLALSPTCPVQTA